jgi:glycogen debranching enzyme
MDKMGESQRAGNSGTPATPRDGILLLKHALSKLDLAVVCSGADVEIIGLLKSALHWLVRLHAQEEFGYDGVRISDKQYLLYSKWELSIMQSFESWFWVPIDATEDQMYHIDQGLVNRRGIYKVTVNYGCNYIR